LQSFLIFEQTVENYTHCQA